MDYTQTQWHCMEYEYAVDRQHTQWSHTDIHKISLFPIHHILWWLPFTAKKHKDPERNNVNIYDKETLWKDTKHTNRECHKFMAVATTTATWHCGEIITKRSLPKKKRKRIWRYVPVATELRLVWEWDYKILSGEWVGVQVRSTAVLCVCIVKTKYLLSG